MEVQQKDVDHPAILPADDSSDRGEYLLLDGRSITCGSVYTHTPILPASSMTSANHALRLSRRLRKQLKQQGIDVTKLD